MRLSKEELFEMFEKLTENQYKSVIWLAEEFSKLNEIAIKKEATR